MVKENELCKNVYDSLVKEKLNIYKEKVDKLAFEAATDLEQILNNYFIGSRVKHKHSHIVGTILSFELRSCIVGDGETLNSTVYFYVTLELDKEIDNINLKIVTFPLNTLIFVEDI